MSISRWVRRKAARRLGLVRERKTKIVSRSIWLFLTRRCPLACRHCCVCGSPRGESMSIEQVEQAIDHLPAGLETLGFIGGEPFLEMELLRHALRSIDARRFRSLRHVEVTTTGIWASDRKRTRWVLDELVHLGINHFNIFGWDQWHWERGLSRVRQESLVSALEDDIGACRQKEVEKTVESLFDSPQNITYDVKRTGPILPIGRAAWATAPQEQATPDTNPICHVRPFLHLNPNGYLFNINFNGEVHYCPFYTGAPLGNIFHRPLVDILRRARQNPLFQMLNKGNVVEFARAYGDMSEEEAQREIRAKGRCVLCYETLRLYFSEKPDAPILYQVFDEERERYEERRAGSPPS